MGLGSADVTEDATTDEARAGAGAAQEGPVAEPVRTAWEERLDALRARRDALGAGDYAAGLEALIAELAARLHEKRADDATDATDARVYVHACHDAYAAGLFAGRDVEGLRTLQAPVSEHGPGDAAVSLGHLVAYTLVDRGELKSAVAVLEDCARRFPEEPYAAFVRLDLLAQLLDRIGRKQDALRTANELIQRSQSGPAVRDDMLAAGYCTRAQIRFDAGVFDRALRDIEHAREHARRAGSKDLEFAVLTTQLDYLLGQSQFESVVRLTEDRTGWTAAQAAQLGVSRGAALLHLEAADPARTPAADAMLADVLAEPELPYEWRSFALRKRVSIALDRGELETAAERARELDAHRPLDAAAFAEGSADAGDLDAVAICTRLALAQANADLDARWDLHRAAFEALLRRWDEAGARRGGAGRLQLNRWRQVVAEFLRLAMARRPGRDGVEQALGELLEVQARSSLAVDLDAPSPSVADVRAALGERHGALVFLPAAATTLVFAFDRDELICEVARPEWEIVQRVRALDRQLMDPDAAGGGGFEELAEDVAALVFPGAVRELVESWSSLTVVGADLLRDLPIEVLPLRDGTTLGEAVAVDHTASLPARLALPARAAGGRGVVLFATLEPDAEIAARERIAARSVPNARVAELRAVWGDAPFEVVLDRRFTVGRVLEQDLGGVAVLHLLAHGVWQDDREVGAVLAVHPDRAAPDGLLTAEVVDRLTDVPPLVIVSACRAAEAYERRGDGHYNTLAGAFLRRGARAVILSRDDLRLGDHMTLLRSLHAALAAGASPAEALRRARHELTAGSRDMARLRETRLQVVGCGH